ncbi:MAG TPA: EAL domain-containing protein [Noviherbaspirillum sp.]|uniref:bifunctional diguanylate cyclase/phosphodiesterase n=1 Tax=Noviherbaspirillum sp. TaxID=1926288 RepID=UPI002D71E486|nr:EAL domain-containing protein [Noviherbaspirillum sp.]HYD96357.1 EAL domain-containing protein [Noviherbaspirillum sp.]
MSKMLNTYRQSDPLARRVLAYILVCSTCLAFLSTAMQLLLDYRHGVSAIELRFDEIERSYVDSVGASLWTMDEQQTGTQLEGIARLPGILLVELRDPAGKLLVRTGALANPDANTIRRAIPIKFSENGTEESRFPLGTLYVTASLDDLYGELQDKVLLILITQTAKTAIVVFFTLYIFRRFVSRHLSSLADYARRLDLSNLGASLQLRRRPRPEPDALDVVVSAFNDMTSSIKRDVEELASYRQGLERLVEQRTAELAQKVAEKEEAIARLHLEMAERRLAEQAARENEERYRQVVEMSPDAILIERNDRIIFVNQGTLTLLGAPNAEQVKAMPFLQMVPLGWRERMQEKMDEMLAPHNESRSFEGKLVRFDGTLIDVEIRRATFQYGGEPAVQTVIHDITRHKDYEEQLRRQALHDALTGLPNRLLLMDRMTQAIAAADRSGEVFHVLFFDLDRFKYVNDTLGHDAGDELLKTITARMGECARKGDTLARLGGDEFVLMLEGIGDDDAVAALVSRIMQRICEPVLLGTQEVSVTCSIGISVYPRDARDPFTLLKYADTAMYHAKEKGRNGVQHYAAEMHSRVNEHLVMESQLRRALERNEFLLQYQPLVDLRSGRIVGAEALLRWRHPELGPVPPARFIPLAEETGLIAGIGEWVMRTACMEARRWHDAGFAGLQVSVNLSAQQLVRGEFEAEVENALACSGLPPSCLELEVTETASMRNPENTVMVLFRLKAMGVGIAIDDFGTGYSNLSYLKRFPVDRLKLDRSFVSDITANPDDSALARAIISMAHSMDLAVVAEGVEIQEQASQLAAFGCDEMQGYHFSPPVDPEAFLDMLKAGRRLDLATGNPVLAVSLA